jgi:hypothetical protein
MNINLIKNAVEKALHLLNKELPTLILEEEKHEYSGLIRELELALKELDDGQRVK